MSPSLGPGSKTDAEGGRVASIASGEMTWMDILDPTPNEMAMLSRDYHFHPLDLDDCLSVRQLTKVEDHGDHLFITLISRTRSEGDRLQASLDVLGEGLPGDPSIRPASSRPRRSSGLAETMKRNGASPCSPRHTWRTG